MSRKIKFNVGYSEYVLLTLKEAEQVAEILDGKGVCHETWIEDGRYSYIADEGYVTPLEFSDGKTCYHTEQDFNTARAAEIERREASDAA